MFTQRSTVAVNSGVVGGTNAKNCIAAAARETVLVICIRCNSSIQRYFLLRYTSRTCRRKVFYDSNSHYTCNMNNAEQR